MLDFFFHPDGIAIIGATSNQHRGGLNILQNILKGYRGRVYPINPRYEEILGEKCYPDIASIPENIDLLIYFIPAKFLPDIINECAKKGVKGIIIESAGFSEVGESGKRLQEKSVKLARKLGIRLWGPNCMGLLDGHSRNVFSFMAFRDMDTQLRPGNVSLIVQSGMLSAGFLVTILERGSMGISRVCSIGNKCDVNETEVLENLINDENTDVIGCYLESFVDGRRFLELAGSTAKPIVVLNAGRSEAGSKAAMSHTASLSGNDVILQGAFRQAGIIRVCDINEMMDISRAFSKVNTYQEGGGVAVVSFSGGGGIVTTDLLADYNLKLADISESTIASLKEVFPKWMPPSNPVDIYPAMELNGPRKVYGKTLESLLNDPDVDSIVIHFNASRRIDLSYLKEYADLAIEKGKPIIAWLIGEFAVINDAATILENMGIPVFSEISRCAGALAAIKEHFRKKRARGVV